MINKNWGKIVYGFVFTLTIFFSVRYSVLASEEIEEISNNIQEYPFLLGTDVSGNNTYINVAVSSSSNNTALDELRETVSANNTTNVLMSADIADINSNLALMVSANAPQFYAYQLTDYYKNYFTGLLENMPRCNYIAFALPKTHYVNGYNQTITHYYLVYNIKRDIQSGDPTLGSYPCYDCYTLSGNYHQDEYNYNLNSLPQSGYGSFEDYSALIDYSVDWRALTVTFVGVALLFILLRRK